MSPRDDDKALWHFQLAMVLALGGVLGFLVGVQVTRAEAPRPVFCLACRAAIAEMEPEVLAREPGDYGESDDGK